VHASPAAVVQRLHEALNRHDLEALVGRFAPDYRSGRPAHPNRGFAGRERVRTNWAAVYAAGPDLRADLPRAAAGGEAAWAEWRWHGRRQDGAPLELRGAVLFGVRDDRIAWGRLYTEAAEAGGAGIDAAVRDLTAARPRGAAGPGSGSW
jgi:ketosteroid isomerase-like protein